MATLTAHCMIRNEPFVYYAVKSIYKYVDIILLYDTGSDDEHTIEDIYKLLDEDDQKKIRFKVHEIETDETKWKVGQARATAKNNEGKKGKWWVRRKMIEDTKTEYFMILDGDEVYYEDTIKEIVNVVIPHWSKNKLCGFVTLNWFMDLEHVFKQSKSGRFFVTDKIGMTESSPNECHTVKATGSRIILSSDCSFLINKGTPYAHFEKMLKPWRRIVSHNDIKLFNGQLPKVMQKNPFYFVRYLNECLHKQLISK